MKNTLLVVADLAGYKAFRLELTDLNRTPRLQLLDEFENPEAHGHIGERVSDLSGRFPRSTGMKGTGAMSDGERHNMELEARKRMVRQLAQRINVLARSQEIERCFLAASKEINGQLLEGLDPQVRTKIEKNIPADLTKLEQTAILRHF
jgi:protein required for attachment to host cells